MNIKREAIKSIILGLQKKKNELEASKAQQTVKEKVKKSSNLIENKIKASDMTHPNDTSNGTKHENCSRKDQESSK